MYIYPASEFDVPEALAALLGSFWANTYDGVHTVESFTHARAQQDLQAFQNLQEAVASLSRHTAPIFHTERWQLLILKESEKNASDASLLQYGDPAVYGPQPITDYEFKYGRPGGLRPYVFPAPEGLVDCRLMFNRIKDPSVTMVKDIDFTIDPTHGAIRFRRDPFENSLIPKRDIIVADEVVDREAAIWMQTCRFEQRLLDEHWGYALGLMAPSSANYRDLLNAVADGLVLGSSEITVRRVVSAAIGIPVVREPEERVERIFSDRDRLLIVTNRHSYRFPLTASPAVDVGDRVFAGDQLVDTVEFHEFNRGTIPSWLAGLTVGRGFLVGSYLGELSFRNTVVPWQITEVDGRTRIEFELGGFPEDVATFWDEVHARGLADGSTLANLLDPRVDPQTEPMAINLPATVNPVEFLVQNLLRNNAYLLRIRVSDLTDEAVGLKHLRILRRLTPPHTTLLLVLELAVVDDPVIMDSPGTEDSPGYSEAVSASRNFETVSESIDPSAMISERVTLQYAAGFCQ